MYGVLANRIRTAETTDRAAHESSVSRKTVAEVPLAGLSIILNTPGWTRTSDPGIRNRAEPAGLFSVPSRFPSEMTDGRAALAAEIMGSATVS
jgi:hypothetical protein